MKIIIRDGTFFKYFSLHKLQCLSILPNYIRTSTKTLWRPLALSKNKSFFIEKISNKTVNHNKFPINTVYNTKNLFVVDLY